MKYELAVNKSDARTLTAIATIKYLSIFFPLSQIPLGGGEEVLRTLWAHAQFNPDSPDKIQPVRIHVSLLPAANTQLTQHTAIY